jgi:glycine hydroxymethyltransferase
MYVLQRFHGRRYDRLNAIIDSLEGHLTSFISLIGSATLPLPEVCEMQGLPGTACRVEGHISARLFPGTDPIDQAESMVADATRRLFDIDDGYAISAQPHSATQANHAVFRALLQSGGGKIVGLSPADGGHISHLLGVPTSTEFLPAPLNNSGIDYDLLEQQVLLHRPAVIVAGGTSYTRAIDYRRLREMADQVKGHLHADLAHTAPFIAAGLHPPAFPFVHSATIDPSKNLRGPTGGILIFRDEESAKNIRRAIFPILQSAPNQAAIFAKAACMCHWTTEELESYSRRMVSHATLLGDRLELLLGQQIYEQTETHLLLFDLSNLPLDGRRAEEALEQARVLANRNQVPGDVKPPWAPSGIRFGTTVTAILQYSDDDVRALGDAICSTLSGEEGQSDTVRRLLDRYHRSIVSSASEST